MDAEVSTNVGDTISLVSSKVHPNDLGVKINAGKPKAFTRGYIACQRCRSRKIKCTVISQPPCVTCERANQACVFKSEKRPRKHREAPKWIQEEGTFEAQIRSDNVDAHSDHLVQAPNVATTEGVGNAQHSSLMERAMISIVPQLDEIPETLPSVHKGFDSQSSARTPANYDIPTVSSVGDHDGASASGRSKWPQHGLIVSRLSDAAPETIAVWKKHSLVRTGWFSAREAVTYIDL